MTRCLVTHWKLHEVLVSRQGLGIGVSLVLPVTNVTLGIGKCEGVGEDSRHGKNTCP